MKAGLLYLLFVVLPLTSFVFDKRTGPSNAVLNIQPIGYNSQGQILCKTYEMVNEIGSYALMPVDFGWLIVDSAGTWEVGLHKEFEGEYGGRDYKALEKEIDHLERWYKSKIDLGNPPKSLLQFLNGRVFNSISELPNGARKYSWKSHQLYDADKNVLQSGVRQRSLSNRYSYGRKGSRVHCKSTYFGVVFFENATGEPDEEEFWEAEGALFFEPDPDNGDYGIDLYQVTGVCLVKD